MTKRFMAVMIGLVLAGLVLAAPQGGKKAKQPKSKKGNEAAAATVKVGAIFAVTGPAANLGAPEARTAEA
ncbi:MAG TPA: hypothetical protein VLM42_11115, partial [Bryobacteraceae bacterium]|nr:hypothetical protein [Bryobacteraceae bacterium]